MLVLVELLTNLNRVNCRVSSHNGELHFLFFCTKTVAFVTYVSKSIPKACALDSLYLRKLKYQQDFFPVFL